jgi:hypothetical protein
LRKGPSRVCFTRPARLVVGSTLEVSRKAKAMSGRGREGVFGGDERENLEEEKPRRGPGARRG